MQYNDLSNKSAPIILFNFENIICEEFSKGLFGVKYKIDMMHVNSINHLYKRDFAIWYISFKLPHSERKIDKIENELEQQGCLFNGTFIPQTVDSLLFFLRQQISASYYDTNRELVEHLYPFGHIWEEHIVQIWNKE